MKRLSTCQQNMYIHVKKKNNKKSWEVKIRNFPNRNQKKRLKLFAFSRWNSKKNIETTKVNKKKRNKEREHFKVINL